MKKTAIIHCVKAAESAIIKGSKTVENIIFIKGEEKMLIVADMNGKIFESSDFADEKYVEYREKSDDDPGIHEFLRGGQKVILDRPRFLVCQNKIEYIVLPACFAGDVYYCRKDGRIAFGTDFFEMCRYAGAVTFDKSLQEEFLTSSYLHGSKTWLEEIKRLKNHCVYYFREERLEKKAIRFPDKKVTYELFKQEMEKCIRRNAAGKRNGLLLSGGTDSRFLAIMLKNNGIPFKAYIGRILPYYTSNLDDVENAVGVCRDLGAEYEIIDIDYRKIKAGETYRELVGLLPNTKHMSVLHMALIKKMKEDGIDTIWCGQNADSLYNLGPTGRVEVSFAGFMNLYKRFCISESFFKAYREVLGYHAATAKIKLLIAKVGLTVYKRMKHEPDLRLPENVSQLAYNFAHSYDYTVFGKNEKVDAGSEIAKSLTTDKIRPEMLKKYLYKKKVENYLRGGESEIIAAVARLHEIYRVILPFSAEEMIPIFYNIRLDGRSVFHPKEYIYRYIEENKRYGKHIAHFGLDKKSLRKYGHVTDVHTIHMLALKESEWGSEISGGKGVKLPAGYTGIQYTQMLLGQYWMNSLIEKLKKEPDVTVTIKEK